MKIATANRKIEGSGVQQTSQFSIAASAKAFRILSDGLYTDKISTILRELACNAFDAHIEAGTADRQFDIKLPNQIDPIFRIRDYGTGMSHEDVMNLYSTYFMSTKTDTNDQIGALGLGSKSPFSYVDSFTVISYFDGKKSIYTLNIGAQGVPEISLMQVVDTDEHPGLEISLAAKVQNFDEFESKARKIYRHFNPLPNITGVENFEIDLRDFVLTGKNWKVYKSNNYYDTRPLAIMGLIEYPIESNKLVEVSNDDKQMLDRMPIAINFKIGELDITSNREGLSYDARTSKNIMKRVKLAIKQISAKAEKEFAGCKTLWEARILYGKIIKSNKAIQTIVKNSSIKLQFDGQELNEPAQFVFYKRGQKDMNWSHDMSVSHICKTHSHRSGKTEATSKKYSTQHSCNYHISIQAKEDTEIFVDDLGRGAVPRLKAYLNARSDHPMLFLIAGNAQDILTAKKHIGIDKFKKVSALPKLPSRARADGTPAPSIRIWKYVRRETSSRYNEVARFSQYWNSDNGGAHNIGGIYVPLKRHVPQTDIRGVSHPSGFKIFLAEADALGVLPEANALYGVPVNQVKKLEKSGKWLNLFDLVKAALVKKAKNQDFREQYTKFKMRSDVWDNISSSIQQLNIGSESAEALLSALNDNMSFVDSNIVNAVANLKMLNAGDEAAINKLNRTIGVMQNMDIEIKRVKTTVDLEKTIKAIIKTYPVISLMFSNDDVFVQHRYYKSHKYSLKDQFSVLLAYVETFATN